MEFRVSDLEFEVAPSTVYRLTVARSHGRTVALSHCRTVASASMIELIQRKRAAVAEACQEFGVRRLEIFGSAVHEDFDAQESDLDFIANVLPPLHPGIAIRFFGLAETLEKIFERPVDLLTDSMIRNPVLRDAVNRDRTVIYEIGDQEKAA